MVIYTDAFGFYAEVASVDVFMSDCDHSGSPRGRFAGLPLTTASVLLFGVQAGMSVTLDETL